MGGLIRNMNGDWIKGFFGFLGILANDYIKPMALKIGLELA